MTQLLTVFKREALYRLRSKGLVGFVLVVCALLIAAGMCVRLAADWGFLDSSSKMALTPQTQPYKQAFDAVAKQTGGLDFKFVNAESTKQARRQVLDGDVDYALVEENGKMVLLSDSEVGVSTQFILTAVSTQQAVFDYVTELGGSQQQLMERAIGAQIEIRHIDKAAAKDAHGQTQHGPDLGSMFASSAVMFVLFSLIIIGSQLIASSVLEEKQSRVIEVILAAINPMKLLAGKILALCFLLLVACAMILVSGWVGLNLSGLAVSLKISSVLAPLSGWFLAYLVTGFLSYGTVYAGMAALASRPEDIGAATAPVTLIAIVSIYVPYFTMLYNPESKVILAFAFIPLLSCFSAPLLIGTGLMSTGQIVVSLVVAAAAVPAFAWLSARIYKNSVLQFGKRKSLFKALAPSRT